MHSEVGAALDQRESEVDGDHEPGRKALWGCRGQQGGEFEDEGPADSKRHDQLGENAVTGRVELAAGRHQEEVDDQEHFCAVLDLYEQALQDFCTFARKRSFNKNMDDDQLYNMLEAKIASPDLLETLESIYVAPTKVSQESQDDQSSWDFINEKDWTSSELDDSSNSLKLESYVVVNQEGIVDGMAGFMAKYVSSLPQLKDLSPKRQQRKSKTRLQGLMQRWKSHGRSTTVWDVF
ncbi:hypothetical protein L7F22_035003 [Adiantum nelumboides]|nr:hypothetical protein [Adiantum nelumboides]